MPTYGYECKSCGHTFDVFQSMSDEPVKICPECGKEVRRLINGGTGVIFKGSGFYVTDKAKGATKTSSSKSGKPEEGTKAAGNAAKNPEKSTACASCPAATSSGGSCPASTAKPEKAAG